MSSRIARIMVLTPSYLPTVGGLERVTELLSREWAKQGIAVRVFRAGAEVDLDGQLRGTGVCRLVHAANWADVVMGVNAPLRQLPMVSHSWSKVVLQHHSMYSYAQRQPWRQRLADVPRRAVISSRPNIAVSDAVAGALLPFPARIIGNPVEFFEFKQTPWSERRYQFLFVGRFTRDKGLDVFLDALSQVGRVGRSAVIGYGPEFRLLNKPDTSEMIRSGELEYLGQLPPLEVARQMANSRWLVIPSRSETFGQVAIEALSQGCGLLVSEVGGLAGHAGLCAWSFSGGNASELAQLMHDSIVLNARPDQWSRHIADLLTAHDVTVAANSYLNFFEESVHQQLFPTSN